MGARGVTPNGHRRGMGRADAVARRPGDLARAPRMRRQASSCRFRSTVARQARAGPRCGCRPRKQRTSRALKNACVFSSLLAAGVPRKSVNSRSACASTSAPRRRRVDADQPPAFGRLAEDHARRADERVVEVHRRDARERSCRGGALASTAPARSKSRRPWRSTSQRSRGPVALALVVHQADERGMVRREADRRADHGREPIGLAGPAASRLPRAPPRDRQNAWSTVARQSFSLPPKWY